MSANNEFPSMCWQTCFDSPSSQRHWSSVSTLPCSLLGFRKLCLSRNPRGKSRMAWRLGSLEARRLVLLVQSTCLRTPRRVEPASHLKSQVSIIQTVLFNKLSAKNICFISFFAFFFCVEIDVTFKSCIQFERLRKMTSIEIKVNSQANIDR